MTDVAVTVVIPVQTRTFYYSAHDWQDAMEGGGVWDLMDFDISNFVPEVEIHGPNGEVIL